MCLCPVVVFCFPLHSRPIALHSRHIPMPDADCMGEVTEMFLSLRYVLFVCVCLFVAVSLVYVCVSVTVFVLMSIIYFYMSLLSSVYILLFLFIYICFYFNFLCVLNRRSFPREKSVFPCGRKRDYMFFPRAFACESVSC